MNRKFCKTSNVKRFLAAIAALEDRGAPEACLVLVEGNAGYGKSRCGAWYTAQQEALLIRLKAECTPRWFLADLVQAIGIANPAHTTEKLFAQAVSELIRDPRPIVIDEIEHALSTARQTKVLDTARDLSDMLEVPVILLGREGSKEKLRREPQIWTRISAVASFQPASREDVAMMVAELCEVAVDDAVIDQLHRQSEGHVRQIVKGIATIEAIARQAKERTVTGPLIEGRELTHDHQRMRAAA